MIFFTEMWERFSYYGMRALLVLYLVNALGYQRADALELYGIYTGLVYLSPLVGGYLADRLRLDYAQFLELELFTRIEGGGDEATRRALDRGRRVRAALVQPSLAPLSQGEQVALLCALEAGALDDVSVDAIGAVRRGLRAALESSCARGLMIAVGCIGMVEQV